MGKLVVGKKQSIALDLGKRDIYGASGFTVLYARENDGAPTIKHDAMTELIAPVEDNNCTADGDTPAGSDKIKVKDTDDNNKVSNFNVGDVVRIKDTDNYFYIAKVDADNGYLYPRFELDFDIADGAELDRVGNTGVYQFKDFTPDKAGRYIFIIKNPSIGLMNKSKVVEVVEHNEDKLYDKLVDIENKLEEKDLIDGDILV